MMSPIQIAPSILSADFGRLAEEIRAIESAGADYIHVDVMDGRFVPNITIGPPVVKALKKVATRPLDVHLMIVEPERWVDAFADAGADIITVHQEACTHLQRTLAEIKKRGCRAGVSLNPATSEETLRYVIDDVDLILVMTVNPGFGGQKFLASQLEKITRLRAMLHAAKNTTAVIEVDGGVDEKTAHDVVKAGASVLVAGNAVFTKPSYADAIRAVRSSGEAGRGDGLIV
jgi:ribulose-phosphate 3-epimerase